MFAEAFLVLAATALVAVFFAFWQSLRFAMGADVGVSTADTVHTDRRNELLEEKEELLQSLRDLAFDRDVGKLSQEDFESVETRLRSRAKEVLRALDQDLGDYLASAEKLVEEAVAAADGEAS